MQFLQHNKCSVLSLCAIKNTIDRFKGIKVIAVFILWLI